MPEFSPARALLINPDQELPSEELTVPLSDRDVQTFQLIERYRSGEKINTLAEELGVTGEALRKRIRICCYNYSGTDRMYQELVRYVVLNKLVTSEDKLENSVDMIGVARADKSLKHAEWLCASLLPDRFAPKREVKNEHRHQVVVVERKPLIVKDIDTQTR
jgi:hypothetical protein